MKKGTLRYIFLLAVLVMATSCKKWLDVSPKTQIRNRELLSSEQGFKDALTGAYIQLGSGALYGQQMTMGFIDAIAYRYNVASTSAPFYQASRYNYLDNTTKGYIAGIWGGLYTNVANINNILTQLDEQKSIFLGNNYNLIKGEALALRALTHFDLLRMFAPAPVVDPNAKAIPYVTRFGISVYPLLTVNEVMDSCMKDLTEAAQLLSSFKTMNLAFNDDPFLSYSRNHMNYWAVKGLQARINLYRGNKSEALAAATEVINNQTGNFPFVQSTAAAATTNRDRLYYSEQLFGLYIFKLKDLQDAYFKTTSVGGTPALAHTSANITALFETSSGGSSDIRFNYQFALYGSGYSTTKFWQDDLNSEHLKGLMPIIRISEMYYIAAECSATPAEGVAFLNAVRTNRGLAALATTISATALETEILKEYKKEFYAEGQLFFYFKRKNTLRVDGSSINAVYTFPLPDNEIEFAKRF